MLVLLGVVVLGFLFLMYHLNSRFQFYFKIAYFCVTVTIICALVIPLNVFSKKRLPNIRSMCYWLDFFFKVYDLQWEVTGTENIEKGRPVVIVANHQSFLDLIGLFHIYKHIYPCVPVVKNDFYCYGSIGLLLWLDGSIFIDRSRPKESKTILTKSIHTLQDKKINVVIFPEGTRNDTGSIMKFKTGAFQSAIECQMPVLPIVFHSYSQFYDAKKYKFENGGKITITILPPVKTKGKTIEDVEELTFKVRSQMSDVFQNQLNLQAEK